MSEEWMRWTEELLDKRPWLQQLLAERGLRLLPGENGWINPFELPDHAVAFFGSRSIEQLADSSGRSALKRPGQQDEGMVVFRRGDALVAIAYVDEATARAIRSSADASKSGGLRSPPRSSAWRAGRCSSSPAEGGIEGPPRGAALFDGLTARRGAVDVQPFCRFTPRGHTMAPARGGIGLDGALPLGVLRRAGVGSCPTDTGRGERTVGSSRSYEAQRTFWFAFNQERPERDMVKSLEKLVEEFAHHVQAQNEEILGGDAKTGNKHAKKVLAAFLQLRAHGDAGRDALAVLFLHPRMDVRVMAAAFLLRHRTAEAKAVLEEAAKGQGLVPFGASEALKRWEEGTWALDPAEDAAGRGGPLVPGDSGGSGPLSGRW